MNYSCTQTEQKKNELLGTWNLKEVQWISKDTTHYLKKPQPGLFLLNKKGYSIMWTPSEEERTPFKILSKPTDIEIKKGFQSIVFNSGSYIHSDSTLVTTAKIAKVPGFVGGKQYYRYALNHEELSLVMYDETYPNGSKPKWSGLWQTKLIFDKK